MIKNRYLIHLINNLTLFIWLNVLSYGIMTIWNLFILEINPIYNLYLIVLNIILTIILSIYQTKKSFNDSNEFDINKYYLQDNEEELFYSNCKVFKYSIVKGKIILTNKRIVFYPDAEFNNFYFDIDINEIKDFAQDNSKQPIIKLKSGLKYNIIIKDLFAFRNKFKELIKSKINIFESTMK